MNRLIEQYVDQVEARLKLLPAEAREQELRELRQHLEALTEAQRERTGDETAAVEAALR